MTPAEWPSRLVPRRPPPFWKALLISAAAFSGAIAARALFLGVDNATGLSVTYFPAFIFATLYAGVRWGWATLALALLFGVLTPTAMPAGVSREALIVLYGLSGALSVLVSGTLRSALLRLDDARATGARIQADLSTSEARSRDSEARFRVLADSAPIMMWISHPDGIREFANRAYVDFLGVSYEEALTFDLRKVLHPEDVDRIWKEQVEASKSRDMFIQEARYRRRDGGYSWIRSITQSRFSPAGEFIGYVGVGHDITDAKRAEDDLKRINDLLAERIEEALAERDQAEAALRRAQKLEAVGQLTGGVAHDFNNLLTIIIGALDLMQRHPDDAARRERMVEAAQGAARRGERLTQQLLAFSRRQALKPERLNVDALLKESEPLLRRAVGEAVNLSMAAGAPDAVAFVDPSQFEAAVMNLVVNARDATPPGGSIRVETFRCSVAAGQVEDLAAGHYLCVAVHDTGEGMNADVIARVFEPFFTTKETGRGTGLGLSQAYGFARQSGGAIAIESAPGQGATVRIYLPFADGVAEDAAGPGPGPDKTAQRGPALKVLLVEDDLAVGDMVEAMLADLGHAVVRAGRPAEALKILRRKLAFDLMLTDVVMPGGKSGVDLAQEAVKLRPGLPIILSSGYTGETLSAAAQAPWPLLLKPYSSETLAETIETVSQGAAAEA
jgi:PAS domain S-box-containing protein